MSFTIFVSCLMYSKWSFYEHLVSVMNAALLCCFNLRACEKWTKFIQDVTLHMHQNCDFLKYINLTNIFHFQLHIFWTPSSCDRCDEKLDGSACFRLPVSQDALSTTSASPAFTRLSAYSYKFGFRESWWSI